MRRLVAVVCIAVLVVTGVTPSASHLLCGFLIPLGPLFGTVIALTVLHVDVVRLATAPFLSVRASRAPPVA